MKYITIVLLLITGCVKFDKSAEIFLKAYKEGCVTVKDVEINGINYGEFLICSKKGKK